MEFFTTVGRSDMPFQVFIGGRGIGKTYSTLADIAKEKKFFLYLRLTKTEIELCCTHDGNPFKKLNSDGVTDISATYREKDGFARFTDNATNELVGYGAPLSTFSNLRGFDFSNVEIIVFDEFMKENNGRHSVKNGGNTLLHLYESVNRNRELLGQDAVKMILLANSTDLADDILLTLGLIRPIEHMLKNVQSRFTDKERGLYLEFVKDCEVSKAKKQTALYKLMNGSSFNEHALNNKFTNDNVDAYCKKVNKIEYTPFLHIAGITVFQHKSDGTYYIATVENKARYMLEDFETEKLKLIFGVAYRIMRATTQVVFDNYQTKIIFDALMKYKN